MTKIINISEIICKRLYFGTTDAKTLPRSTAKYLYITFDDAFNYPDIMAYFGPSDLAIIFRYAEIMNTIMSNTTSKKIIIQCASIKNPHKRTNSAFLIGIYAILVLGMTPDDAVRILLSGNQLPYVPFCDTTSSKSSPTLDLIDYYRGLLKAIEMNIFTFDHFDVVEYERLSYQHGFMNWIIPNKFLAFPTPIESATINGCGLYIEYFKTHNIKTVIRLSDIVYNSHHFTKNGIDHYDLYFDDCTPPTIQLVQEFLKICEKSKYAIAVHCKAGLGRTGTMIAAYMIKHYKFTATEAIGYIRLCRPGSIVSTQQQFLEVHEKWFTNYSSNKRKLDSASLNESMQNRIIKNMPMR